jgi:UDP-N-acetylglucosamine--N-acetylmuramyl-(pentapeptide) pyrophosphoryl-undecaprenol N-acetylglucosamine transferase
MKIFIVAGGTGGHLYPGVALARALVGQHVTFVVRRGDLGKEILNREGFQVEEIAGQGLPRALSWKMFTFPFNFITGCLEAMALLLRHRPDWVVGMGGYLSVPMILTARLFGIRTLLHEQNVFPGLANRILSRVATSVAMSFPESHSYFPKSKSWISGLPIRPEIGQTDQTTGRRAFGLELERTTYLVFGGSLGAQRINTLMTEVWPLLLGKGLRFQVLHVAGRNDHERVKTFYQHVSFPAQVLPYCHDMASAYAAADIVISRAGASTVAELLVSKRRALLIPYPHATNNHQVFNAKILEKSGLGKMMLEKGLTAPPVVEFLAHPPPAASPVSIHEMSSNAAPRLAEHLTAKAV